MGDEPSHYLKETLEKLRAHLLEAGLARKEMRTTNAPSKQNEVMT
jgi:hypothetical protein